MAEETNHKPYRLGLALSGGGAKGFAHIGVFRMMEECALRPDIIVGTSAGALMGTLFADGYSAAEIQELFTGREFSEFAQLQIPMVIVATDLDNGESHEFRSGPIVEAVTASCSIPIIFSPVVINGVHYVDGGLFHNFPVSIIREECERIIGVNVSPLIPQKYKQTIFHIAERSYHYMFRANTLEDREMCDVLIEAEEFGLYKTFDLENVDVICNIGYSAAARCFEKVLDENKYETLVKAIAARKKGLMP